MNLDQFARACTATCSTYWLRHVPRLRQCLTTFSGSGVEIAAVLRRAAAHARQGQKGRAANWLAAAWLIDQARTLELVRREGLFRASKYQFEAMVPRFLVEESLSHADELSLEMQARSLLGAAHGLLSLGPSARKEFTDLLALLRREPNTLLRSCLITLDLLFLRDAFRDLDFGLPWHPEPYSKEELGEGFSLFWSHAHREIRITKTSAGLWDALGIYQGRYLGLLKRAAALREFTESEILIETFGYRCDTDGAQAAIVSPPSPEIEKGIRLGYIDAEMRRVRSMLEGQESGTASLRQLGERLHRSMTTSDRIRVMHPDTPLHRVRFEFPILPSLVEALRNEGAALEEWSGVAEVVDAYGLTPANAGEFRVRGHLTIRDIQHAQRLAIITASCIATELYRRRHDPVVFINSASPVYRTDAALDSFLQTILEPAAANEFREMFRWPPESAEVPGGFDVQYRPLLEAEHEWHVPMFILAFSNLTRAAFVLTHQKPNADRDVLEAPLVQAFQEAGHLAVSRVKLRTGATVVGEIDVAALVDDTLVVLECKNSLHPCNVFELRTSRDRCTEAVVQLDRVREVLGHPQHMRALLARLNGAGRPVARTVFGIVLGNRLFIGSRFGGYLVVSPGNLANFISQGEIRLGSQAVQTRPSGRLTGEAIRGFFEGSYYDRIFAAMTPLTRVAILAGKELRFATYALDVLAVGREFGMEIDPTELMGQRPFSSHSPPCTD